MRRHLDVRKASFGPVDVVTSLTGMEYGGITPIGLPDSWPVLVDNLVAKTPLVVVGSGIRASNSGCRGACSPNCPARRSSGPGNLMS